MRIRPESFAFTALIAALAALPPLSIDMGLPALGLLQSELGASATEASGTLSLFLFGFACGQLVMGPLSDRFGRRPVMLVGLAIYALFGVLCALATSPTGLLIFRLLEGIGASGATTLAMAVVRDRFSGEAARIKMSTVTIVITMAPIIAPSIGALMLVLGEWRFIYLTLGLAGITLIVAVFFGLDESHPADNGARIDLVGRYAAVFRSRRTLGYAAINAMGSGALFSFIGTSSLVLMGQMGLSAQAFGLTFALTSSGILTGSMLNNFLARRGVGARMPIIVGLCLAPVAAALSSSFLIAGFATAWTYVPFIMLGGFSRGLITSNATFAALEPVPAHAGAAAAVLGCSQTACAGLAGMLVAALFPAFGALAVTASMFLFTMAALFAWIWVEAKHPARPHG